MLIPQNDSYLCPRGPETEYTEPSGSLLEAHSHVHRTVKLLTKIVTITQHTQTNINKTFFENKRKVQIVKLNLADEK
jgi:hypothetical protein